MTCECIYTLTLQTSRLHGKRIKEHRYCQVGENFEKSPKQQVMIVTIRVSILHGKWFRKIDIVSSVEICKKSPKQQVMILTVQIQYYMANESGKEILSMPNFELTAPSGQSLAFQLPGSSLQLPGSRLRATYSSCKPVASRPTIPEAKKQIRGFGKSRGFDWEWYEQSIKKLWKSLKTYGKGYISRKTYCFIKRFLFFHRFYSQNWDSS